MLLLIADKTQHFTIKEQNTRKMMKFLLTNSEQRVSKT